MRKILGWFGGALLAVSLATPAHAQGDATRDAREGFYGSLGIASGSLTLSCSGCSSSGTSGTSGYLALGGTLSPSLRLGVEYLGWTKSEGGASLTISYYTAAATIYPSLSNGLWVQGNLGWSKATFSILGSSGSNTGGLAAGIGLGYDWLPGRGGFALIPYVNYMAQLSASNGEGKANVLQLGLGIGYKH